MKTIVFNKLEVLKEIRLITNFIIFKILKQILKNIIKIIMNKKIF